MTWLPLPCDGGTLRVLGGRNGIRQPVLNRMAGLVLGDVFVTREAEALVAVLGVLSRVDRILGVGVHDVAAGAHPKDR